MVDRARLLPCPAGQSRDPDTMEWEAPTRRGRALGAALLMAMAFTGPLQAETHQVPGDFASIQEAVNAAAANDSIVVGPGTYETEVTMTIPLTIVSSDGSGSTILTGNDQHRVFDLVDADLTLIGFTLEFAGDGSAVVPSSVVGGALRSGDGHTLVVEDCVFRNNKAGKGGAIAVAVNCDLTVRRCSFLDNNPGLFEPGTSYRASGVDVGLGSTGLIEDCTFTNNRSGQGAAIGAAGTITVTRCTFENNWANNAGGAISLLGSGGTAGGTIEDCTFTGNHASKGGACNLIPSAPVTVRSCEFIGNDAGLVGGALELSGNVFLLQDNQFIDNVLSDSAVGGGAAIHTGASQGMTIENCFFRGNEARNISTQLYGGGALWLAENAQNGGSDIRDCTFVENFAIRGSVAVIEWLGAGPDFPRFERCLFALNSGGSLFQCGLPEENAAMASIDCSMIFSNTPDNTVCAEINPENVIILQGAPNNQVFCDSSLDMICSDSLAATQPCGVMGGMPQCGPCTTPVQEATWGQIKNHFGPPDSKR